MVYLGCLFDCIFKSVFTTQDDLVLRRALVVLLGFGQTMMPLAPFYISTNDSDPKKIPNKCLGKVKNNFVLTWVIQFS